MKKANLMFSAHLLVSSVYSQQFQNLNFEQANLPPIPAGQFGGFVPIASAFPGWSANVPIFQNNISGGEATIDILGPHWQPQGVLQIIAGQYTAVLQSGEGFQGNISATLEQTGQIPATAKSILVDTAGNVSAGAFTMNFGGHNLPFVPIAAGPNYEEYGADISAYASQTDVLSFSGNPVGQNFFGTIVLDNILFSPNVIPEPSTWALMICGAGAFIWSRWTKRR